LKKIEENFLEVQVLEEVRVRGAGGGQMGYNLASVLSKSDANLFDCIFQSHKPKNLI
jgi:hypothetical protein